MTSGEGVRELSTLTPFVIDGGGEGRRQCAGGYGIWKKGAGVEQCNLIRDGRRGGVGGGRGHEMRARR